MQEVQFFKDHMCPVTLLDVKPKLNQQNDKRIRLDFCVALTAALVKAAPQDVQDAFYALCKEGSHMNPIGISTEFDGVIASFYATEKTKHASLELQNCTLKQLEVSRPENKAILGDGDVKLSFHMNIPASRDAWNWSYGAYGTDFAAVFEEMQPVFPQIKEANPNGDGQGILDMEKQQVEPTVVKPDPPMSARARAEKVLGGKDDMPHQGKEQKKAVSKIAGKKVKK